MQNNLEIKKKLFELCCLVYNNRLETIQFQIKEINTALTSETKSSAGDKHETGRAMLQLEREKAGNQLAEIVNTKEALSKIRVDNTSKTISLGSVVFTTKANYYIAISAGELTFDNNKFYAISPNTPIGKLLIGRQVGDEVTFRSERFFIESVF